MAPFARRTFGEMVRSRTGDPALAQASPAVAYFYDLYANFNDPELALTVERLLTAHDIRVIVPEQRASGIPEMLYGYAPRARELAAFNVRAALQHIRAGATLVSAEPTATFAFKVHYPDYLGSSDCSLVANATRDLGEFLLRHRLDHPQAAPAAGPLSRAPLAGRATEVRGKTGPDAASPRLRVGYHQPCHLKAQQVGNPGLELLLEIPGVELIDLAAGCCGMAGTFGMKAGTYDFSLQTGRPLFERIAEVSPDLIASECSTCRMQLAQATGLGTVHPATLLAESYGL